MEVATKNERNRCSHHPGHKVSAVPVDLDALKARVEQLRVTDPDSEERYDLYFEILDGTLHPIAMFVEDIVSDIEMWLMELPESLPIEQERYVQTFSEWQLALRKVEHKLFNVGDMENDVKDLKDLDNTIASLEKVIAAAPSQPAIA